MQRIATAGNLLTAAALVWCVLLATSQSLYLTKAYKENTKPLAQFTNEELKPMTYYTETVVSLEEVTNFLKPYGGSEESMVVVGAVPILHFLTDIRPYISGCGGWIETDYVTADEIADQLSGAVKAPIIVIHEDEDWVAAEKTQTVMKYVGEKNYETVFSNETYTVYMCSGNQ